MALVSEIIPFTLPASTGAATFTVNHVRYPSIQAGAYIFVCATNTGVNIPRTWAFGLDDGTTHLSNSFGFSGNPFGSATLTARGVSSTYSILTERSQAFFGGAVRLLAGYISAVNIGSFDVTLDQNDTPSAQWYAVMIGGSGVQCKVGIYDVSAGPGTATIGFDPAAIIKISAVDAGANSDVAGADGSYGFAAPCSSEQVGWGISCATFAGDARSFQVEGNIQDTITPTSSALVNEVTITAYPSNGVTFLFSGTPIWNIGYLAIGGSAVSANLVSITQPTITGIQNTTLLAGDPVLALFGSTNKVALSSSGTTDANLTFGAYDGVSNLSRWAGTPNVAAKVFDSRISTTKSVVLATATSEGGSALNAEASCTLASTQLTLNWTTVDATQREIWALVLASNPTDDPTNVCGIINPDTLLLSCPTAVGQVGFVYSSSFSATGGIPPYTFTIIGGALPGGLTLNGSSGSVTGTPTSAGTFNFTAEVADSGVSTTTTNCSIVISDEPPSPCTPSSTPENVITLLPGVDISGF